MSIVVEPTNAISLNAVQEAGFWSFELVGLSVCVDVSIRYWISNIPRIGFGCLSGIVSLRFLIMFWSAWHEVKLNCGSSGFGEGERGMREEWSLQRVYAWKVIAWWLLGIKSGKYERTILDCQSFADLHLFCSSAQLVCHSERLHFFSCFQTSWFQCSLEVVKFQAEGGGECIPQWEGEFSGDIWGRVWLLGKLYTNWRAPGLWFRTLERYAILQPCEFRLLLQSPRGVKAKAGNIWAQESLSLQEEGRSLVAQKFL